MGPKTIKSLAEEFAVEPKVIKQILGMRMSMGGDTELEGYQIEKVNDHFSGKDEKENGLTEFTVISDDGDGDEDYVIFYWAGNRNETFCVNANGPDMPKTFYETKNSVIKLNKFDDAAAIKYLEKNPGNIANHGVRFIKLTDKIEAITSEGALIDELSKLSVKTLAEMVAKEGEPSLPYTHQSKGTLIFSLLKKHMDK